MAVKVVVKKLEAKSASRQSDTGVTTKRVRGEDGRNRTLLTLDAGSRSFDSDLKFVFSRNVQKARKDNKKIVGRPDGVVES